MILLIDNYDSFVYNLYQLVGSINQDIYVVRNDQISINDIERLNPSHIILSPGPGRPENSGICVEVMKSFARKIPILGICLGHQIIGQYFGAKIDYAKNIVHGKATEIELTRKSILFKHLDRKIIGARYHSLVVSRETIPAQLEVTAQTVDGEIMALEHKFYPVYGVQFHPESILTKNGKQIVRNFLLYGGGNYDKTSYLSVE